MALTLPDGTVVTDLAAFLQDLRTRVEALERRVTNDDVMKPLAAARARGAGRPS